MVFPDRSAAGEELAQELVKRKLTNPYVLALSRGGVPVAVPIAKQLKAALDVLVVRKLGFPHSPNLAFGAIAPGKVMVLDDTLIRTIGIADDEFTSVIAREEAELKRRLNLYRNSESYPDLSKNTVILVDDGIATGATMRVAIKFAKSLHAESLVVASPVCSHDMLSVIKREADDTAFLFLPYELGTVSRWYAKFGPVSDSEIVKALTEYKDRR
jgi:putative phosphoribosyl transferase